MSSETVETAEGTLLWEPSAEVRERSNLRDYLGWLREKKQLDFQSYADLYRWSVDDLAAFWSSIWEYFDVESHSPHTSALADQKMPGARWFEGATLNYAEHALRRRDDHLAVIYRSEGGERRELTYGDLASQVARARAGLKRLGVERGDRVVAFMPNAPETLVAFLAAASLGATWSSASPEFGVDSVLDRFKQIEPKVLIAVDGYQHGGKQFSRVRETAQIREGLPSLEATVVLPRIGEPPPAGDSILTWSELVAEEGPLEFEAVPFDHPLWILYSSGTTGLPKAIVQGHGGILLEHYKALSLHCDLGPGDRFFWFTTTGWMMWNFLVSGLLLGTTLVLYEGSPGYPDLMALWRVAAEEKISFFGTSAPFLIACKKADLAPGRDCNLTSVRAVGSTGAPLPADGFGYVYQAVGSDLLLASVCGGTDVCTAFILSCPLLPVHAGEIQCNGLGCRVEAFAPGGEPVVGEVGECVLTLPMPSMPLFFWNDPDGKRYEESYFSVYPGVWRHGDWIKLTERGSSVVYGRSDSTLNRGGVRMGTSEFYRVVDGIDEVIDSLVVDTGVLGEEGRLFLFVVLAEGAVLDDATVKKIKTALRTSLSPRHVPDEIHAVADVPKTLSGKKLEVPIKRIMAGEPLERAVNPGTLANPSALDAFMRFARG